MSSSGALYEFAFRGFLAEEALDRAGRLHPNMVGALAEGFAEKLGIELLDEQFVTSARSMGMVYMAVTAFENSVRKFISNVLLEKLGENWWDTAASAAMKRKVETRQREEERTRWHTPRGAAPITYTDMGDLANIMRNNFAHFEAHIPSIEWAGAVLDVIERSRNVIMHSGHLGREDVERIGINIRDWVKQVGT
jgi:hypothetical protein